MKCPSCGHIFEGSKEKEGKIAFGQLQNVYLTYIEFEKLIEKFGNRDYVFTLLEKLSLYIASKGDKYKSHYATILAWNLKDNGKKETPYVQTEKTAKSSDPYMKCSCGLSIPFEAGEWTCACGEEYGGTLPKIELKSIPKTPDAQKANVEALK